MSDSRWNLKRSQDVGSLYPVGFKIECATRSPGGFDNALIAGLHPQCFIISRSGVKNLPNNFTGGVGAACLGCTLRAAAQPEQPGTLALMM